MYNHKSQNHYNSSFDKAPILHAHGARLTMDSLKTLYALFMLF